MCSSFRNRRFESDGRAVRQSGSNGTPPEFGRLLPPNCPPARVPVVGSLLLLLILLSSCDRETRRFREVPPTASAGSLVRQSPLQPGPTIREINLRSEYEENAYALSEGKRLYKQYNCVGCHGQGGGAIGPALMDDQWIYGSEPENIYATIVEGRPNGMPAFGGKIGTTQVWQLAAYVRSLSGWIRKDVAPGRDDAMQVKSQEQGTTEQEPRQSFTPPSSEQP
jgi:cytochrome c oxidase cbb3-type subunit III